MSKPPATTSAVTEATRLEQIKFPEFTTKLLTDTFDALIAANIRQIEAYTHLVKTVSQDLKDYINNTKNDIPGEMIFQFLSNILEDPTKIREKGNLTADEAKNLKNAITISDIQETTEIIKEGPITDKKTVDTILLAVASRIAADKYIVLKEMVKMGVLRLIVDSGEIETKITFNTYTSNTYKENNNKNNTSKFSVNAAVKTGCFISQWLAASAATTHSTIKVSTANNSTINQTKNKVEIFGRIQINFKTDYQTLNTTTANTTTTQG
ncbi:MAG: hypothetical protein FWD52_03105 [Candidatus Bathyarchaeota archaeon]|nr:hypothetical protein [Candidatus Termiticorpusculum sp.]